MKHPLTYFLAFCASTFTGAFMGVVALPFLFLVLERVFG